MPAQKDLKRVIRSRMAKTGESYTAARSQLMKTRGRVDASTRVAPRLPDYAKLAE